MRRPPFILSTAEVPETDFAYPKSEERMAPSRAIGRAAGLLRIGLHIQRVPPGRRTSWPHAEEKEEEFVYVLSGEIDAWIDGHLHRMKAGDLAAFPAGTGVAHTFLNDGPREAVLLVGGEAPKSDNRITYPRDLGRRADMPWSHWWSDAPSAPLGPHDGRPRAVPAIGEGTSLELWDRGLGRVPAEVLGRTDLERLVLAGNSLTELPPEIGGLTRLRMLDLGHNRLRAVPESLGALSQLTDFLYLHDNQLTSLPVSLGGLTRLRYLNLSQNRFAELPEAVASMRALVELRAAGNEIVALPEAFGQLTKLRELDLRDNPLQTLPDEIAALVELRALDLRGTALRSLPPALAGLPQLEKLDLRWAKALVAPTWLEGLEARGCRVYR